MKVRLPSITINNKGMKEIRRQCSKANEEYIDDAEYMMAWILHKYYGFGIKRLLAFRKHFRDEYKNMTAYYEMNDVYPVKCKLKEIGYDVDILNEGDKNEQA